MRLRPSKLLFHSLCALTSLGSGVLQLDSRPPWAAETEFLQRWPQTWQAWKPYIYLLNQFSISCSCHMGSGDSLWSDSLFSLHSWSLLLNKPLKTWPDSAGNPKKHGQEGGDKRSTPSLGRAQSWLMKAPAGPLYPSSFVHIVCLAHSSGRLSSLFKF